MTLVKWCMISLTVLLGSISAMSVSEVPQKPETTFTNVAIPEQYQSSFTTGDTEIYGIRVLNQENQVVTGQIKFVFREGDEPKLISLAISDNIFEETSLDPNFWVEHNPDDPQADFLNIGNCLSGCNSQESKVLRILCKIGCWGGFFVAIAVGIASIFQE